MSANSTCNAITAPTAADFSWAVLPPIGCTGAFIPAQVVGAWVKLNADGTGVVGWFGAQQTGTWLPAGRSASEYSVKTVKFNAMMCPSGAPIAAIPGTDAYNVDLSLATSRDFSIEGTMTSTSTAHLDLFTTVTHVASGDESVVGVYGSVAGSSIVACEIC